MITLRHHEFRGHIPTATMGDLTHFDSAGQAHMVDIAAKRDSHRIAIAAGTIVMRAETLQRIEDGSASKGDVLSIARIAAIQGAKRTSELIPLCHPLALTSISIEFTVLRERNAVECSARAETVGRTGVEMEAMTAVSVALLTIYDMCKAMDRGMHFEGVRLLEKRGGKSGHWQATAED